MGFRYTHEKKSLKKANAISTIENEIPERLHGSTKLENRIEV